jgi:hypothetical protein
MNYEDIQRLHLNQLRQAVRVRLLKVVSWVDASGNPQQAPAAPSASPFFFNLNNTQVIITSKTTDQLADASAQLLAASAVAKRQGAGKLTESEAGMRVQLFFPEALFSGQYVDQAPKMSYIDFRNAQYLALAKRLQADMPALLTALGTVAAPAPQLDFSNLPAYVKSIAKHAAPAIGGQLGRVGLLGQNMAERGILGLELDLPKIVGANTNALRLVRDASWVMLARKQADTPLLEFVAATLGGDGADAAELSWPLSTDASAQKELLPGFGDQSRHVQLLLQESMAQGADLDMNLRANGMFTAKFGDERVFISGRQTDLNGAAACQIAGDNHPVPNSGNRGGVQPGGCGRTDG